MAFGKKKEDEFFVMFRDFAKALAVTMILGAAVSILFNLIY